MWSYLIQKILPDISMMQSVTRHTKVYGVLLWKTWNMNTFLIDSGCSFICLIYPVFYTNKWLCLEVGVGLHAQKGINTLM